MTWRRLCGVAALLLAAGGPAAWPAGSAPDWKTVVPWREVQTEDEAAKAV